MSAREIIQQTRDDATATLNLEHFRELGKYENLMRQIKGVITDVVKEQGKLTLYPAGDQAVTALIQNCHILNTALEKVSGLVSELERK